MAQAVRRGLPPVQKPTREGVQSRLEGQKRITPDVVTTRSEIVMGDEGVPNPSQYISRKARA